MWYNTKSKITKIIHVKTCEDLRLAANECVVFFSSSEKRIKMKKEQDPIERLAFHLITYRDVAVNVANNGLNSEQLSFPIDRYLGEISLFFFED